MAKQSPEAPTSHTVRRRLVTIALLSASGIALLVAVPGLRPVLRDAERVNLWWLVLGVALEFLSCVSFVVVFRMFFDHVPTVPAHELAWTEMASGALLPGGGVGSLAVGGLLLHQAGEPTRRIVVRSSGLFFYTSAASVAALVGGSILLLSGASGGRGGVLRAGLPLAAGVIVTLAVISITALVAGRTLTSARGKVLRDTADGITEALHFVFHPTWRGLGSIGYLGFDIAVLWATLGAAGYHPPIATLLLGYIVGYMANLLPVPAGIGVLEAGLAGTLILYGAPAVPAAAGVIVYHAIAFWVPTAGGLVGYALLRGRIKRHIADIAAAPDQDSASST